MILITGASRGIGKYLFEKYLYNDENVYGTYLNTPHASIKRMRQVDVKSLADVSGWFDYLKLDQNVTEEIVLINNAGINYNSFAHKSDFNDWCNVIWINLMGTFNVIRKFLPYMREVGYGRIINISSVVGQKGVVGTSAYAASKSGLSGMTRAIAVENAKKGITVNNINLGYVNAGITTHEIPIDKLGEISEQVPMGGLIDLESIYYTINYIIRSSWLTGTSIDLNGGLV